MMDTVDGNAIAGQLMEIFGVEVTTAIGTCGTCGRAAPIAELVVVLRGPGTVGRCRSCGSILIVVTAIRGVSCVDLGGLSELVMV